MIDLRVGRAAVRMTQAELARAAGVTQVAVSRAESGRASPRVRAAILAALFRLGVQPTDPFAPRSPEAA